MDEQNRPAEAPAEPAPGPAGTAAGPGPAGPAVIHARGLEPPRSLVTSRAPEPGAPAAAGRPVGRRAPPAGAPIVQPGQAPPSERLRIAVLEGRVEALEGAIARLQATAQAYGAIAPPGMTIEDALLVRSSAPGAPGAASPHPLLGEPRSGERAPPPAAPA